RVWIRQASTLAADENLPDVERLVFLFGRCLFLAFGIFVGDALPGLGRRADDHLTEDIGISTVIGLGPAIEGMLVTLSAFQPNAHERGRGLLSPLLDRDIGPAPPEQIER